MKTYKSILALLLYMVLFQAHSQHIKSSSSLPGGSLYSNEDQALIMMADDDYTANINQEEETLKKKNDDVPANSHYRASDQKMTRWEDSLFEPSYIESQQRRIALNRRKRVD